MRKWVSLHFVPWSLCPRLLCPGHFVPWSLCPRSLCPRSLCPLVTFSPGHLSPVTLSPVTLSPWSLCPWSLCPPVTLCPGHFVPRSLVQDKKDRDAFINSTAVKQRRQGSRGRRQNLALRFLFGQICRWLTSTLN
jgi:hypothetical protein